jgi:hypothetical protein
MAGGIHVLRILPVWNGACFECNIQQGHMHSKASTKLLQKKSEDFVALFLNSKKKGYQSVRGNELTTTRKKFKQSLNSSNSEEATENSEF